MRNKESWEGRRICNITLKINHEGINHNNKTIFFLTSYKVCNKLDKQEMLFIKMPVHFLVAYTFGPSQYYILLLECCIHLDSD